MTNRFTFNVNKYQIESDGKYFAYLNVVDAHKIVKELNKLHYENQEYKRILQDLGLLRSDKEIMDIRKEISDKLIKPLFEENGLNIDVDITDGFTIIPKGE